MTLGVSLTIVFLAFCALMGGVLAYCIRERRLIEASDRGEPGDRCASNASPSAIARRDRRIVQVLFGAIVGGAALALITGYLVFVRAWD